MAALFVWKTLLAALIVLLVVIPAEVGSMNRAQDEQDTLDPAG